MDDLREALSGAFDSAEAESPVTATPEVSTPETKESEGRARDVAGKFAKVEAKEAPAPTDPQAPPVEAAPPRKAPSSWKPDAQTVWLKAAEGQVLTPDELKMLTAETERRESDFHKGAQEFKSHSERARQYDQVTAPYQQTFQALGVDAPTAISHLLKADNTLRYGSPDVKAQYFRQLAQEYGIDLGHVSNLPPEDPNVRALREQNEMLQQRVQKWDNQFREQEANKVNSELSEFTSNPAHVHFDAVRGDMAKLLESGAATSLKDAYEKAVWGNPDIRQTLIEQQRAEAQQKATTQLQQTRAKTAAISVKGSSPSAGGASVGKGSLRDTLEEAFANQ